jgi:glycosyltransferase involved in cell wall biosynthesis
MRIAIIGSRGIPARYGGFETFAQELAPRLVRRGHAVTVYCRKGYTGPHPPRTFEGVALRYTPYLRRRSLETLSHEFTSVLDSLRRPFDTYYFLGTRSSPLYLLARLTGRRVVVHTDGIEWKRRKWGAVGRAYLRFAEWLAARFAADELVTDAQAMRDYYLDRYHRESWCIPYGAPVVDSADAAPLSRFGLEAGGYYLVVCRLEPENNVDRIIRGFLDSGTQRELVVVGGAKYPSAYQRSLRQMVIGRPVRLLGPVFGRELEALRYHAFAYLHGHEVGGTNPSLLEAMGCGNCCLALDTPFNREALADAGLFWHTEGELSGLIATLEREAETRRLLASRARPRVRECYSWDAAAGSHAMMFDPLSASR